MTVDEMLGKYGLIGMPSPQEEKMVMLEELLAKKSELCDEGFAHRTQAREIEMKVREAEQEISLLLLGQYEFERGDEVVYNDATMFVDGMGIVFSKPYVVLVEHMDGYTPFNYFGLASPEAEKVSRRYQVEEAEMSYIFPKSNGQT